MNKDQLNSLIRTLLKVIGSALTTHGLSNAASLVNSEDMIGLILLVAGLIWSHYHHGEDDNTPRSNTSVYAWLLIGALAFAVMPGATGCKSTPQQITYNTAAATTITVETALKAYNVFAAQGKTTIEQNRQVKAAYEKYQAAFAVVCDAGTIYAASSDTIGGTNAPAASLALQQAVINANASLNDIINLIRSFGVKL